MKRTIIILLASALTAASGPAPLHAQKWSIATNLLDYANLLTLNAEAGISVDQHWSLLAEGRYNPFSFRTPGGGLMQNRTLSISAGTRYWPFFVYSGFYYGGRLQWSRFNTGGILSDCAVEGDAFGLGFNFGYSLMLTEHLNIEFGLGLWFGAAGYREYASTVCGKLTGSGIKAFIAPNDIQINLLYNF
ncbi:MAG TPA: DUF3575 domain-containing protein [Candidatus Coprenecus pullistercoris]|nr:DUF3575 domain-containing protein [Candidatus Coprenecus pullistercoris]